MKVAMRKAALSTDAVGSVAAGWAGACCWAGGCEHAARAMRVRAVSLRIEFVPQKLEAKGIEERAENDAADQTRDQTDDEKGWGRVSVANEGIPPPYQEKDPQTKVSPEPEGGHDARCLKQLELQFSHLAIQICDVFVVRHDAPFPPEECLRP